MERSPGQPKLREIWSSEQVRERIDALCGALYAECAGRPRAPILLVIAEGALRFARSLADGLTQREIVPEMHVVRARRSVGTRLGAVEVGELDTSILRGRDVIVSDDIADEGETLRAVLERVRAGAPASVRVAVLVSKTARRRVPLRLDFVGFELRDGWVVGYGMDLDGAYRDLDYLAIVE